MNSKNVKSVLKTQAKVISYVVICLVVIVIGISYSLYSDVESNQKNQIVTAGTLVFEYSQKAAITAESCFNQVTEEDAKTHTECEYTVTITNKGTLPGKYSLTLKKKTPTSGTHIEFNKLKVILKQGSQTAAAKTVTETTGNLVSNAILNAGANITYSILVYVDEGSVTEIDNDKAISLEVEGTAEVNPTSINP